MRHLEARGASRSFAWGKDAGGAGSCGCSSARRATNGSGIGTACSRLHAIRVDSSRGRRVRRHRNTVIITVMHSKRGPRVNIHDAAGGRGAARAFALTIFATRSGDIDGKRECTRGLAVNVGAASVQRP